MASRKDSITGIRSFEDAVRRTGRNNRTLSQQRIYIKDGVPSVNELKDGVPVLRFVQNEGFFQYVKYKGQIYRTKFDSVEGVVKKQPLEPHYDSGWINVTKAGEYEFVHNLGSKMLMSQWYFRTDPGATPDEGIFDLTSNVSHEMDDNPTSEDTGLSIFMETANKISVGIGDHNVFITNNNISAIGTSSYTKYDDGFLRCFLWRIGKSE